MPLVITEFLPVVEAAIAEVTSPSPANTLNLVQAAGSALNAATGNKIPQADLTAFIQSIWNIAVNDLHI